MVVGEGADLSALNSAVETCNLAEPLVERDGGVGGADHSDCDAEKVPQGLPRALLPVNYRSGSRGGGGRCEPATEEDVGRWPRRMEWGVAADELVGEAATKEPGEQRHHAVFNATDTTNKNGVVQHRARPTKSLRNFLSDQ